MNDKLKFFLKLYQYQTKSEYYVCQQFKRILKEEEQIIQLNSSQQVQTIVEQLKHKYYQKPNEESNKEFLQFLNRLSFLILRKVVNIQLKKA
ncbi:unnamed protein product (macronuclear) [Paramecium tetraurelia]|uniref:Uncharacterized protein n=1 Tax=Paramecium tetraurelia TaxID=5888 RepID=A0DDX2_PARTE|nr:uncharacterized protein GSPATT00016080001 [Paramecium tetraurelia]CAK81239.1 unnamed protein product [Paramecium tetraurelia]|eukprot:XP_001448636.1 hypothetical protein (macronuclear) [Paramecium tetraurelia strain d4-2]